jgi:hypothetical protein
MSFSTGLATLVLALEIGRHDIVPADYPKLLTSVRISFLIFTALSVAGVAASLVGPRKTAVPGTDPGQPPSRASA